MARRPRARAPRRAVRACRLHAAACAAAAGYRNATQLYTWLFQASAATLREVAADPRHLGAEIGVLSILHTWGQTLVRHPHVHCVVPAGGLSPDHQRWIRPKYAGFFLPIKVLSRVFRGKFVAALRRAYVRGDLDLAGATERLRDPAQWHTFVDALFETDWIVYAKPAFGGASAVLRYLGRYTHRVAISNHRLIAFDGERVTFQWKDYARGHQWRTMTLTAMEFLRRFVQHVLPRGFVRIRQCGYLASTCRTARLALARRLLRRASPPAETSSTTAGLALSAMRSADGHRPDPLGAPAGHRHPRLRHLMSAQPTSSSTGVFANVTAHVSGVVCLDPWSRARRVARRTRTPDLRSACRRRSRADGPSIDDASRSTIPIPAP